MCQPRAVMAWMPVSCSTKNDRQFVEILLHMDIIRTDWKNRHQFPCFLSSILYWIETNSFLVRAKWDQFWFSLSLFFQTWFCIHFSCDHVNLILRRPLLVILLSFRPHLFTHLLCLQLLILKNYKQYAFTEWMNENIWIILHRVLFFSVVDLP